MTLGIRRAPDSTLHNLLERTPLDKERQHFQIPFLPRVRVQLGAPCRGHEFQTYGAPSILSCLSEVCRTKVSPSRNRDIDRISKTLHKNLDCIVAKILWRRPRKGSAVIRPKTNSSGTPYRGRIDHEQISTSFVYSLPSWRKKLKGQLPDNIRVAAKFHPENGAVGIALPKDGHIVLRAESGLPLERCKPALNPWWYRQGSLKSLPSGSRKERIVGKSMVCDNSLHEGKRSKKGRALTVERERLTFKNCP